MDPAKLRLAVVDRSAIVRQGLMAILRDWPHGEVVVEAANGLEYERACAGLPRIHIALVGMQMEVRDGCQTMEWMRRNQKRTLALAMANGPGALMARRALRHGARGMVCKTISKEGLFTALDELRTGRFHYNELVDRGLRLKVQQELQQQEEQRQQDPSLLTARLREFLLLYTDLPLLSLAKTAERLGITRHGADDLRKRVGKLIGCTTRVEMVHYVWTKGMRLN